MCYEGLVQFAADGSVLPRLALSWEISDDGLSYVFHLSSGVRFHDGSAFDAAAAKFSLERVLAPGSTNPQKIAPARRFAPSRSSILSPCGCCSAAAPADCCNRWRWSVRHGVAAHPPRPMRCGPSARARFDSCDGAAATRSPWSAIRITGAAPALLSQVTFKFISDPTAAYAALMAGDVDAFSNYPAPESFAQFAADPRFEVFIGTTEMETVLALNERVAPLGNVLVRRAISYALDRRAIIDGAMFGYGTPIGSHFPPHNPAYVDLTGMYPHDIAKAKALLAQAGYPDGFCGHPEAAAAELCAPRRRDRRRAARRRSASACSIENLEWAQWLDQVFTRHDFDMSIVGHAEPMDYDIYARDDYYFGYSNAEFKALIAALDDSIDARARKDLLQQIQRKLADDAVNGFLFQYPRLGYLECALHGIGFDNVLGVVDVTRAYFDDAARVRRRRSRIGNARRRHCGLPARLCCWREPWSCCVLSARRFGSAYLAGRAAVLLATLLAATAIVFVIVQIVPGDPVRYMMGLQADPETVAAMRHQLGLDAAPLQRYVRLGRRLAARGFRSSYTYRIPVGASDRRAPAGVLAAGACTRLLLSRRWPFRSACVAAARRGRARDAVVTGLTQLGLAVPNFWLGMLLVMVFAVGLHWVSAGGFPGWEAGFWPAVKALTLPAIALAMPQAAILARVLRGALIDTLHEDYIRTRAPRAPASGGCCGGMRCPTRWCRC